jgi:hypothetical protein
LADDQCIAAGSHPRLVEVIDAQQPPAACGARIEIAGECGDQRAQM